MMKQQNRLRMAKQGCSQRVWLWLVRSVVLAIPLVFGSGGSAQAQISGSTATVIADAPIYVQVGFATPMRVAALGTRLTVVGRRSDQWTQVEFQDPQFGKRIGWIETNRISVENPALRPMDLSVREAPDRLRETVPPTKPEAAVVGQQRTTNQISPVTRQAREGFWFNVGLGLGSLGCEDCRERVNGLSGGLAFGATVSDRVLLGVGTTGFARDEGGDLLSVGTLDGRVRFYPSRTAGFFINGGLGLGTLSYAGDTEFGLGLMLGLGWDIRVGERLSVTPFWNGSAMANSNVDANYGQLGIGVTFH